MTAGILKRFTPSTVLGATIFLLIASWVYPPGYTSSRERHKWFFLFDMSSTMRVDFGRLILLNAIIVTLGASLAWLISRSEKARRIAARVVLCLLVGVPLFAGTWMLVRHTGYVMWKYREQQAETTKKVQEREGRNKRLANLNAAVAAALHSPCFAGEVLAAIEELRNHGYKDDEIYSALAERFNGFLEIKEFGEKSGYELKPNESSYFALQSLERALREDSLRVALHDLGKITLIEAAPADYGGSLVNFHGRIRNDLVRPVHKIGAKASIYDAGGTLLEVCNFWLNPTNAPRQDSPNGYVKALPGEPISFQTQVSVNNLPRGFTYKVQIVEAHYVR